MHQKFVFLHSQVHTRMSIPVQGLVLAVIVSKKAESDVLSLRLHNFMSTFANMTGALAAGHVP